MSSTKNLPNHRSDDTLGGRWQLDPERSSVAFHVGMLWGLATVRGRFDHYQGRLDLSADPAIDLTIDAASIDTDNPRRDRHLRSADFFDANNHPRVRFVSDSVVLQGETLKVQGSLFARGQSIPLELDGRARRVDGALEIEAATTARHRELGMTWSPLGTISPRSELRVHGYLVPAPE